MTEEKGILDDIEELVSDFRKKKNYISPKDYVDKFFHDKIDNMERTLGPPGDFRRWHREQYRQEYSKEPEYNRQTKSNCECGTNCIIYMYQDEGLADYMRNVREPLSFRDAYEKSFYCVKCGRKCYVRMDSVFEIVSIKHEEDLKI